MNPTAVDLPVLEPGDHLTGEEFDRRYELRPDIHKAELVHGVVYMPHPSAPLSTVTP